MYAWTCRLPLKKNVPMQQSDASNVRATRIGGSEAALVLHNLLWTGKKWTEMPKHLTSPYECPLCHSPLTEGHYHKVVKIQARREKAAKGEVEKLKKQVANTKAQMKQKITAARADARAK